MSITGGTHNSSFSVTRNNGVIDISGVTVNGCDDYRCGQIDTNSGHVTLAGGVFNSSLDIQRNQGTIDITGGTMSGCSNYDCGLVVDTNRGSVSIFDIDVQNDFEIQRLGEEGTIVIEGGTFAGNSSVTLSQGELIIRGGDFSGWLYGTVSGTTATTIFEGSNWTLDGVALNFTGDTLDLSGQTGMLSGLLADGNDFAVRIDNPGSNNGFSASTLTVVNVIPIPAPLVLLGSALASLGVLRIKSGNKQGVAGV